MFDVVIIGAGVTGSAVAREISKYKVKACVLEKGEDVCVGTSKANSGIVHAGFDARTGSLMAKLNVEGNALMEQLSKDLDFTFKRNGALIVCLNKEELPDLQKLYEKGVANGVKDLELISPERAKELEPNITDDLAGALYAPTSGIVCPFELNTAMAENAYANGVEFRFGVEVAELKKEGEIWTIKTKSGEIISTKCVVNATGVYADEFHNMVSEKKIHITPRRGEYLLLDKTTEGFVKQTIFQLPNQFGKGVLVTPTAHGNTMLGPTATDIENKEGNHTSPEGIAHILKKINTVNEVPARKVITSFAGLRAHEDNHEFIIEEVEDAKGFIDCAGIESPGLTSAPAVGLRVASILKNILSLEENPEFIGIRKGILNPKKLSKEAYATLIQENEAYGTIVCRCEMVTEGEIIDAIRRPLGAKSLDGVKRRTRAGMGRCQAGFCSPKTMEIIARELQIPIEEVTKSGGNSKIIVGRNKDLV
ncbi:MAG: NAD(P)/FAD-dependent oxidoreductase [Bacillota bacterium]